MKLLYFFILFTGCVADAAPGDEPGPLPNTTQRDDDMGKGDFPAATSACVAVLAAAPYGDLRLYDADSGALIDTEPANAVDVYASPDAPGKAFITEWHEDGGGALVTLAVDAHAMVRIESLPLSAQDVRVIHAPSPTVGLALHEGTTLFDGGEGRTVFGTSSYWVEPSGPGLTLALLERTVRCPRLARYRWDSSLRKVSDAPTQSLPFDCAPRLARGGSEPVLVGGFAQALVAQLPSGQIRHWVAGALAPKACVEDALWLTDNVLAVISGPDIRVHLLSMEEGSSEHLSLDGRLEHDPHPHRRLAFDIERSRLWIALPEGLAGWLRTDDGRWVNEPQTYGQAESLTLVY